MDIKKEEEVAPQALSNHLNEFSENDVSKFEAFVPSQMSLIPSQMTGEEFDQYFPIPEEFLRPSSGSSVIDNDSVTDDSGRTFHGSDGKYMLPNDAAEQDRLDFQHKMISLILDGRLALAPMKQAPKYVLDVACGTGIWAIDWAQQNPTSFVIGTDISAIQPDNHPKNCEFIKDDAEKEWIYPQVPAFDFIHLRFVALAFDDPVKVMSHAVNSLAEGGWIEYQETSPVNLEWMEEILEGDAILKISSLFKQGLIMSGRETLIAEKLKGWMQDAGLVDVTERKFMIPLNTWPEDKKLKRIGQYMCTDVCDGVRGASWKMLKAMGLSTMEIENLVTQFKEEARNEKNRFFYTFYVVCGRKPFSGEV